MSHKKRTCPDVSRGWKMETIARCDSLDVAIRRCIFIHDGTVEYIHFTIFYFCISTKDKMSLFYLRKIILITSFEVFVSIMYY